MRILITNTALANRAGSELYVRDLATALLDRGHLPIVYSPVHGEVAAEIRKATIPVIDDLEKVSVFPDIIHGHHHFETMTALLRFPGVPALYVCHGWLPWEESPPRFPRILRYLAVDYTCRDRLIYEHAIPEEHVQVLLNFVDLQRFLPRSPLPPQPQRALLFSNAAQEKTHLGVVQKACAQSGLTLEVMGRQSDSASPYPETVLGEYDIVFAKGRCALEALAVGAAVILCDAVGAGPMVTSQELERLRTLNCGIRTLREPLTPEVLVREIARYTPSDAAQVSQRIRATAGRDATIDALILLYQEILKEYGDNKSDDVSVEGAAAAAYFRWLSPTLKNKGKIVNKGAQLEAHCTRLQTALAAARTRAAEAEAATKVARKALDARETEL
ncbi:MAG: glycosyltransferase, partial [Candidatus Binatia bacterium]